VGFLGSLFGKKQVPPVANSQTATRIADVDEVASDDKSGSTKLILACSHGDLEGVRQLLAQGASVNLTNKFGATALDVTYQNGDDVRYRSIYAEIAALLRARGGKTNKWTGRAL
jgi:ankyrin repeat protein